MLKWASIETRSDKKAVKFLGLGFVSLHNMIVGLRGTDKIEMVMPHDRAFKGRSALGLAVNKRRTLLFL
jgi:hypothetical protein